MQIRISNSPEIVSIKLTISYEGPSEYVYVVNLTRKFSYPVPGQPSRTFPHEYDLDAGKNLLKPGNRNNNWSVELLNPSGQDLNYEVKITWHQSGQQIMEWSKEGAVTSASGSKLINDDCSFIP